MAAGLHHGLTLPRGSVAGVKGGFFGLLHTYPSEMAQTFWTAIIAFSTCLVVTAVVSLVTSPRKDEELVGLVYALTPKPNDEAIPFMRRPWTLAVVVIIVTTSLNLLFF